MKPLCVIQFCIQWREKNLQENRSLSKSCILLVTIRFVIFLTIQKMHYCVFLKMKSSIDTFITSSRTMSSEKKKCSYDNFQPSHLAKVESEQYKIFLCLLKCCLFTHELIQFTSYCLPVLAIYHSWSIHFKHSKCFSLSAHLQSGKLIDGMRHKLIQLLLLTTSVNCQLCAQYQIALGTLETCKKMDIVSALNESAV